MCAVLKLYEAVRTVSNEDFWIWFIREIEARGLTYNDVNERGGKRFAGAPTIWRAANERSELSLPMVATIAQAFGMTRLEVLRKAGFVTIGPKDLEGADLTLIELWELMRKLPIEQQRLMIKMVGALLKDDEPA